MAQKQIDAHKVAAESSTPSSEVRENSEKKKGKTLSNGKFVSFHRGISKQMFIFLVTGSFSGLAKTQRQPHGLGRSGRGGRSHSGAGSVMG